MSFNIISLSSVIRNLLFSTYPYMSQTLNQIQFSMPPLEDDLSTSRTAGAYVTSGKEKSTETRSCYCPD